MHEKRDWLDSSLSNSLTSDAKSFHSIYFSCPDITPCRRFYGVAFNDWRKGNEATGNEMKMPRKADTSGRRVRRSEKRPGDCG